MYIRPWDERIYPRKSYENESQINISSNKHVLNKPKDSFTYFYLSYSRPSFTHSSIIIHFPSPLLLHSPFPSAIYLFIDYHPFSLLPLVSTLPFSPRRPQDRQRRRTSDSGSALMLLKVTRHWDVWSCLWGSRDGMLCYGCVIRDTR